NAQKFCPRDKRRPTTRTRSYPRCNGSSKLACNSTTRCRSGSFSCFRRGRGRFAPVLITLRLYPRTGESVHGSPKSSPASCQTTRKVCRVALSPLAHRIHQGTSHEDHQTRSRGGIKRCSYGRGARERIRVCTDGA